MDKVWVIVSAGKVVGKWNWEKSVGTAPGPDEGGVGATRGTRTELEESVATDAGGCSH